MNETKYSDLQNEILDEISKFCEECPARDVECPEDGCVLFRIEQIVIKED